MKVLQRACQLHLKQEQARQAACTASVPASEAANQLHALIQQIEHATSDADLKALNHTCQQWQRTQVTKQEQKQPAKHLLL
ncbi:hypothetical protein V6U78_02820 [Marinospirillum sp. MEB164]|uniref:Uncharacterized protein n=1 Tax=Marinospirillum alkalitolerans TaxID=3123374 RepID=A0ABW8PVP7_9GAMM